MKNLSSSLTYFVKYFSLIIWTPLVIIVYFVLLETELAVEYSSAGLVWLFGCIAIYFNFSRITKVEVDERNIHVSTFFKSETIPFTAVKSVSGSRFVYPEMVWFVLKERSSFGKIITFMPKQRFSLLQYHHHPTVEYLADLCGLDDW
jgi:hypothetical protein